MEDSPLETEVVFSTVLRWYENKRPASHSGQSKPEVQSYSTLGYIQGFIHRVGGAQKGRVEQCLCQDLHIVSNLYQPAKHISTTTSIQKLQQQMEGLTVNNSLKVSLKDSLLTTSKYKNAPQRGVSDSLKESRSNMLSVSHLQ